MDAQPMEQARQPWQDATDAMPQLICLLDPGGRVIGVNPTLGHWGWLDLAQVRGRSLHELIHPGCDDPYCAFALFWQRAAARLAIGAATSGEFFDPVLARDLAVRVHALAGPASPWPQTGDTHAIVVVDDVTARERARLGQLRNYAALEARVMQESQRRRSSEDMQARLLAILEKTSDSVAMLDAAGQTQYLNPAGQALLGMAPGDDIAGMRLCQYSDDEVKGRIWGEGFSSAKRDGLWTGKSRLRDKAGREIHASHIIIAHRDEDGRVENLSTIVHDSTDQECAEQALRESRAALRQLSARLVSIQEDERKRIAQDLHDGLGQTLSLLKLSVEQTIRRLGAGAGAEAGASLRQLVPRIAEALTEVRRIAADLRPSMLDDLGILPTLSWYFREFEQACGVLQVERVFSVSEDEVPAPLHITIYRIVQEAMHNVVKHAAADRVRVRLERLGDELQLRVEDNGRGFDTGRRTAAPERGHRGMGLFSMQERAACSGGTFRLTSAPGQGTCIRVAWRCARGEA